MRRIVFKKVIKNKQYVKNYAQNMAYCFINKLQITKLV